MISPRFVLTAFVFAGLLGAQTAQATFPSAAAAGEELFKAVQNDDLKAIVLILGDREGLVFIRRGRAG